MGWKSLVAEETGSGGGRRNGQKRQEVERGSRKRKAD